MFMSYFLFGNYCCLDSLHSPPCIRKNNTLTYENMSNRKKEQCQVHPTSHLAIWSLR